MIVIFLHGCILMSDQDQKPGAEEAPENTFFNEVRQEHVPSLDAVPELDEDTVLRLTRRVRLRQMRLDLEAHGGEMPKDPEERKIFMQNLKELEGSAAKIKMIGAKEKSNATERLAVEAVLRIATQMGTQNPYAQTVSEGGVTRAPPSIEDAKDLPVLELVPDETSVGVADMTYEQVFKEE